MTNLDPRVLKRIEQDVLVEMTKHQVRRTVPNTQGIERLAEKLLTAEATRAQKLVEALKEISDQGYWGKNADHRKLLDEYCATATEALNEYFGRGDEE